MMLRSRQTKATKRSVDRTCKCPVFLFVAYPIAAKQIFHRQFRLNPFTWFLRSHSKLCGRLVELAANSEKKTATTGLAIWQNFDYQRKNKTSWQPIRQWPRKQEQNWTEWPCNTVWQIPRPIITTEAAWLTWYSSSRGRRNGFSFTEFENAVGSKARAASMQREEWREWECKWVRFCMSVINNKAWHIPCKQKETVDG